MTSVILGLNRFEDCRTLIAWREHPVLSAESGLASLQLDTTGLGDRIRELRVDGQKLSQGTNAQLIKSDVGTTVLVDDKAVLYATKIDASTLHIKLDLRPLGINIFDDVEGLHVGKNLIAHNSFTGSQVGISLG